MCLLHVLEHFKQLLKKSPKKTPRCQTPPPPLSQTCLTFGTIFFSGRPLRGKEAAAAAAFPLGLLIGLRVRRPSDWTAGVNIL